VKTEAYKLYSRMFWIFLPNVIKIDPYSFKLYRFKVVAFFLRHSVQLVLFPAARSLVPLKLQPNGAIQMYYYY